MRWERELEWRQKQRSSRSGSSSGPSQPNKSPGPGGGPPSPYDRRPSTNEAMMKDKDKRVGKFYPEGGEHVILPCFIKFFNNKKIMFADDNLQDLNENNRRSSTSPKPIPAALRNRRKSQVSKQHSYDDEIKNLGKKSNSNVLDSNAGIGVRILFEDFAEG